MKWSDRKRHWSFANAVDCPISGRRTLFVRLWWAQMTDRRAAGKPPRGSRWAVGTSKCTPLYLRLELRVFSFADRSRKRTVTRSGSTFWNPITRGQQQQQQFPGGFSASHTCACKTSSKLLPRETRSGSRAVTQILRRWLGNGSKLHFAVFHVVSEKVKKDL